MSDVKSSLESYRYGFNGKYKDNEWAGLGNHYNYGARLQDARIGRFINIDPLTTKYPMLTPYQFAANSPIFSVDRDGFEDEWYIKLKRLGNHALVSIANGPTLIATSIGFAVGNQFHVWVTEGCHEGVAYKTTNPDWAVPYTWDDNWNLVAHKSLMTPETLTWEEGKTVMSATLDVDLNVVKIYPFFEPQKITQKAVNETVDYFSKLGISSAVEKTMNLGDKTNGVSSGVSGATGGGSATGWDVNIGTPNGQIITNHRSADGADTYTNEKGESVNKDGTPATSSKGSTPAGATPSAGGNASTPAAGTSGGGGASGGGGGTSGGGTKSGG